MNIYKVLPDLANRKQMSLWHKALRAQWSAEDVDWSAPRGKLAEVGIDTEGLFSKLCSETEERLEHSIRRGRSTAGVGEDASVAPVAG